jgi:putative drug exporter of the RND superfamily
VAAPEPPGTDQTATSGRAQPVVGVLARGYAFAVVSLRYFIVGGWIAGLVLAFLFLPRLGTSASGGLSDLIPKHTSAARATADATRLFGAPLDAGVAIVQRNPHGIPAAAQHRAVRQAIAVDRGLSGRPGQLAQAPLRGRPGRWASRCPRTPGRCWWCCCSG